MTKKEQQTLVDLVAKVYQALRTMVSIRKGGQVRARTRKKAKRNKADQRP